MPERQVYWEGNWAFALATYLATAVINEVAGSTVLDLDSEVVFF